MTSWFHLLFLSVLHCLIGLTGPYTCQAHLSFRDLALAFPCLEYPSSIYINHSAPYFHHVFLQIFLYEVTCTILFKITSPSRTSGLLCPVLFCMVLVIFLNQNKSVFLHGIAGKTITPLYPTDDLHICISYKIVGSLKRVFFF